MRIEIGDIVLRDMVASDIEDDIRWNTVDMEWHDWDAPWEKDEPFDADEYRRNALEKLAKVKDDSQMRLEFEIDYMGRHIGSVNCYRIDDNYEWTPDKEGHLALGIDINEPEFWNRGIGGTAFAAWMDYLFSQGFNELYTQTWSGNVRMLRMAERLGFTLCHRKIGNFTVRGQVYDGVTLRITAVS